MKKQIERESEAKQEAVATLLENEALHCGRKVLTACPNNVGNYFSVWARDAVVSSLGIVHSGNEQLLRAAENSLDLLAQHQTERGRVPAYVSLADPTQPHPEFGGWGRIETLDSQMWYVLGAVELFRKTQDSKYISPQKIDSYRRSLELLEYRASESSQLVDWPVSAGWDDQMQRRHHVLSLESLRILAYQGFAELLQASNESGLVEQYLQKAAELRQIVRSTFWLDQEKASWIFANASEFGPGYFSSFAPQLIEMLQEKPVQFFTSYLAPYEISPQHIRFDTYANVLAILSGVATYEQSELIFEYIKTAAVNQPWPVRVLDPAVIPGDADFHPFYEHGRNKPHQYQNGAIWPHITGLYILAAKKLGKEKEAVEALNRMVLMVSQPGNQKTKWGFNEYYHGQTGLPTEDAHDDQAWSAAGLLYALAAVQEGKLVLPLDS